MKRENKIKFTVNDLDRNDLSFSLYAVPSVCCVVATLDDRTTLVLSNIRELDRELFYKLAYLYSSTGGPY